MHGCTSLNLARLTDRFEDAAERGDANSMDRMIDRLAKKVQFDDGDLESLNARLDRLGKKARELGSSFDGDNELIQRLRSAVLANADEGDGLKTALGEVPIDQLMEEARNLSARLRDNGQHRDADAVDAAIGELEKIASPQGWEPPKSEGWQAPSCAEHCRERSHDRMTRGLEDLLGEARGLGYQRDGDLLDQILSALESGNVGDQLVEDAEDLAGRLDNSGRSSDANTIHAAIRELTKPRRTNNERWL